MYMQQKNEKLNIYTYEKLNIYTYETSFGITIEHNIVIS